MKTLTSMIYFLFLAYAKCAFLSSTERNQWKEFKLKYNKTYSSAIEENHHQEVFLKNLKEFEQHNGKYKAGLVSYTKGINQFADMTIEDFSKRLYRFNIKKTHRTPTEKFFLPSGFQVPNEIDWRKKGAVTSVKNQMTCGSCWSFSATGALESQLFIKKNVLVSLSEQNLVDCSKHLGNHGCDGGTPSLAFEYIQQNNGIDTEESYPYENREGECRFNPDTVGGTCRGFVNVDPDEDALKYAVATVGPISVGINSVTLQHYEGGILNEPNCDPEDINHTVVVVGYGNENGLNYWILKNSWGVQFGEDGYARIARNQNNYCGVTTVATYPLV